MIEPELYDIVELRVDLPQVKLKAGQLGTIVEQHQENIYEVEFSGEEGKTLACLAVSSDQFIVVWKSSTATWVPVIERIQSMLEYLPSERQAQVLDFTRSLSVG